MDELIVSPFFLFTGMHYSKDVPGLITEAIEETGKKIDFKMLKPVGKHPDIFNLVQEILYEEVADQLEYKHVPPSMIEQRSMEMIENFLYGDHVPEDQKPVIKRVIHTTGDFDFMRNMVFHKDAISEGLRAIRAKKIIYTDVTMVQAGINKRFGHEVRCMLDSPEVTEGRQVKD